uniref:SGR1 n=1 Tax=Arundo donax TaxID=35708 RepID=A0A0A9D7W2_ARUDO
MRSSRKCPPEMWQWTCSDIRPRTFFHSATTSSRCSRLYHPCSCARLMVCETASVRLAVTSLCVSVYVRGSTGFPAGCLLFASSTPRNSTFSFDASKIAGPNSLAVGTTYRLRRASWGRRRNTTTAPEPCCLSWEIGSRDMVEAEVAAAMLAPWNGPKVAGKLGPRKAPQRMDRARAVAT